MSVANQKAAVAVALKKCHMPHLMFDDLDDGVLSNEKMLRKVKNANAVSLTLEQWGPAGPADPFRASVEQALVGTPGELRVVTPSWKDFEDSFLSGEAKPLPDGRLVEEMLDDVMKGTEPHKHHITTIWALQLTPAKAVMITEPYGFGKTRVTMLAACCRFANKLIVVVVTDTNFDFTVAEARYTTANVIKWNPRCEAELGGGQTTLCVVKRGHAGALAKALKPATPALIIADEAFRENKTEPDYIRAMQSMQAGTWWITDAYVTAKAAIRNNDDQRTTALWKQVNRFLRLAGGEELPACIPRHVMQQHIVQHKANVMNDLAGEVVTRGWKKIADHLTPYTDGDQFTQERAASLMAEVSAYLTARPAIPRRVVVMGSFGNKPYALHTARKTIARSLQSVAGVELFNSGGQSVSADVDKFNAATPDAPGIAVFLVSMGTTRQVTLKADVMVCVGDGARLEGTTMINRRSVVQKRHAYAVYASTLSRIRRYEPEPSDKHYIYGYSYKAPPKPTRKRGRAAERGGAAKRAKKSL